MIKYKQVTTGKTSQSTEDFQWHHAVDEKDPTLAPPINNVPLRDTSFPPVTSSRLIRRTNSQRSLGSHKSVDVRRNGEDIGFSRDTEDDCQNTGEKSPLHGSFDDEELCQAAPNGALSSNSRGSLSPQAAASSVTVLYKNSSFHLDDDEDDADVIDLRRYHVDFSSTNRGYSLTNSDSIGGGTSMNHEYSTSQIGCRLSVVRRLWRAFQSARQKARERRAHLLLQQTEHDWRQSLWIFILTLCDATDRGILLVAAMMTAWLIAIIVSKNPIVRRRVILVGTGFFGIRLGTRPLIEFCLRQRQKRRQNSMQPIPQDSPRRGILQDSPRRGMISPISSTPGRFYNKETGKDTKLPEVLALSDRNNKDSLPGLQMSFSNGSDQSDRNNKDSLPGLQLSYSNGSDPMVAAI